MENKGKTIKKCLIYQQVTLAYNWYQNHDQTNIPGMTNILLFYHYSCHRDGFETAV